jgi:hypothetical protein
MTFFGIAFTRPNCFFFFERNDFHILYTKNPLNFLQTLSNRHVALLQTLQDRHVAL